jgi:hypothetical protein
MEAGKVIENVIIFGGIGAMAYLLFKKPVQPTLSAFNITENLSNKCANDLKSLEFQKEKFNYENSSNGKLSREEIQKLENQYNNDKAKFDNSDCVKSESKIDPNYDEILYDHNRKPNGMLGDLCRKTASGLMLQNSNYNKEYIVGKCRDLSYRRYGKNEMTEDLISDSVYLSQRLLASGNDYYSPSGDILANTCVDIDNQLKDVQDNLIAVRKMNNSNLASGFEKIKADLEAKFNKFNCRDKIEAVRTRMLVDLQSKGSIKAEESNVAKSFTEQKTYIIIGALVLLTGFYVVVKK